ncbi:MAG: NAD+ synthase [Candidatus Omnitrophica bacterium]|nr:NAD+ synthase [Candidatus Omnitrophota bacterium]
MKIALAQINPCVGAFEKNYDQIIAAVDRAARRRARLVIFPELALSGYPPEDLLLKPHFLRKNAFFLSKLARRVRKIRVLLGCVTRRGARCYNSCAVLSEGRIEDVYRKIYLPNYGVFDEKRYFAPGGEISVYEESGIRFAVGICEDVWSAQYLQALKGERIDFLAVISASPFHLHKIKLRRKILRRAARFLGTPIVFCNLVGGQDELVFDGTSKIVSARGHVIAAAKRFQEDLLLHDFKIKGVHKPVKLPSLREEEEAFRALSLGLSDYVRKNGFTRVIVGVSGGIDSAVVLSIAALTLGKKNVHGLLMPSRYSSKETLRDAERLCGNLGVSYETIPIEPVYEQYLRLLSPRRNNESPDKTEENIQARIRGNLLMAYSNKYGYLVLNTGNKSELSCGYCTLYGDMVGGFGLLKDVPKLLVYKLARSINRVNQRRIIPVSILRRIPSAELRPNQKDTDSLPEYPVLDPILRMYVEEDKSLQEISNAGFPISVVKRVIRLVDANEYKRRQSPVGIKITPKSLGKDRRMPITNQFRYD